MVRFLKIEITAKKKNLHFRPTDIAWNRIGNSESRDLRGKIKTDQAA
jgi:hypothetical protein